MEKERKKPRILMLSIGNFTEKYIVPFNTVIILRSAPPLGKNEVLKKFVGADDKLFLGNQSLHQHLIEAAHAEGFLPGKFPASIQEEKSHIVAAGTLRYDGVEDWISIGYSFETPQELRAELHRLIARIMSDQERPLRPTDAA